MRAPQQLSFDERPGAVPQGRAGRALDVSRQFNFLLQAFTPRTVFMEVGSADGELSLRAATYVERVWCVECAGPIGRGPCNLRRGGLGGVPLQSVDVAFSESATELESIQHLLA